MERAILNMHQCAWMVDRQRAEHCAQRNVHSLRSTHSKPERDWELAAAAAARVRNVTASGEARPSGGHGFAACNMQAHTETPHRTAAHGARSGKACSAARCWGAADGGAFKAEIG